MLVETHQFVGWIDVHKDCGWIFFASILKFAAKSISNLGSPISSLLTNSHVGLEALTCHGPYHKSIREGVTL